jgi:hypothetical protein
MRSTGHVELIGEKRDAYGILSQTLKVIGPVGWLRHI